MNGFDISEATLSQVLRELDHWEDETYKLQQLYKAGKLQKEVYDEARLMTNLLKGMAEDMSAVEAEGGKFFVLRSSRGIEGFAGYYIKADGNAELSWLTSAPWNAKGLAERTPGVGTSLVDYVFKDVLNTKAPSIRLTPTQIARGFYKRIGFNEVEILPGLTEFQIDRAGMAALTRKLTAAYEVSKPQTIAGIPIREFESSKAFNAVARAFSSIPDEMIELSGIKEIVGMPAIYTEWAEDCLFNVVGNRLYINYGMLERFPAGTRAMAMRQSFGAVVWDSLPAAKKAQWTRMFNRGVTGDVGMTSDHAFEIMFARMNDGFAREVGVMKYFPEVDNFFRNSWSASYKKLTPAESVFRSFFKGTGYVRAQTTTLNRTMINQAESTLVDFYRKLDMVDQAWKVKLTDTTILDLIHDEILSGSRSVIRTFNKELMSQIERICIDFTNQGKKITAKALQDELQPWANSLWNEKRRNLYNWQYQRVKTKMSEEFLKRSGIEDATLFVVPEQWAVCDICKNLVHGNPYTKIPDPAPPVHIHCIHSVEVRSAKVTGELWAGGPG